MTTGKEEEIVIRRRQLLEDFGNKFGYWKLKEEAEDKKGLQRYFITKTLGTKKVIFNNPRT